MTIINQSNILFWIRDNILTTPETCGVYILSDRTQRKIYVGSAGNGRLRDRLMEHFTQGDIPSTMHFSWHQTRTEEDARRIEREWVLRYNPIHNNRV